MKMGSLPDEELYAHYARDRDLAALEQLVARWHQSAYRLARFTCHDANLAEEAVQDAFVKLSSLRAPFQNRGPGSFRAWFLGLIANSASAARRTEMRAQRKREVDPRALLLLKGKGAAQESPGEDLSTLLGSSLAGLEDACRIPLLLHFVEGLQQREVAQALGISQQMVSRRVRQGLGVLKRRLAQAGLAASLPLGGLAALGAQLRDNLQVPPDACARVLRHCAGKAPEAALEIPRTGAPARSGAGPAATGPGSRTVAESFTGPGLAAFWALLLSGAAAGAAFLYSTPRQEITTSQANTADQGSSTARLGKAPPAPTLPGFRRFWTFERGIPSDLAPFRGAWRWDPGKEGRAPAALTKLNRKDGICLELARKVPSAPLRLRARVRLPADLSPAGEPIIGGMSLYWLSSSNQALPCATYLRRQICELTLDASFTFESYVYHEFIVSSPQERERFNAVRDYRRVPDGLRLGIRLHGLALEQLTLEAIEARELPGLLQDPQRLRQQLQTDSKDWTVTQE